MPTVLLVAIATLILGAISLILRRRWTRRTQGRPSSRYIRSRFNDPSASETNSAPRDEPASAPDAPTTAQANLPPPSPTLLPVPSASPDRPTATPPAAASEEPHRPPEDLQFSLYHPGTLRPEVWAPLLVFAHAMRLPPGSAPGTPTPQEQVLEQVRSVLGAEAHNFEELRQNAEMPIPRATELTLVLEIPVPGITINPTFRTFRWLEDVQREEFRVRAATSLDGQTVRGHLLAYRGCLAIARIPLALHVSLSVPDSTDTPPQVRHGQPFRKIFASYSHQDAAIVDQVEDAVLSTGEEFLRDVRHLRVGQDWSPTLERMIEEADSFQLFWSTHSMRSPFVEREWRYALSLGRSEFILPVYWELPLPEDPAKNLPPPELRRIQFHRFRALASTLEPPASPAMPGPPPAPKPITPPSAAPDTAPARNEPGSGGMSPAQPTPRAAGRSFRWLEAVAVLVGLAILSSVMLPSLSRSPRVAHRTRCLSNQKSIGLALHVFAADNDEHFPMQISTNEGGSAEWALVPEGAFGHFLALSNELTSPAILRCPTDQRKMAESNFTQFASIRRARGGPDAALSYFAGLDVGSTEPTTVLLGDRNIVSSTATPPRPDIRVAGVFAMGTGTPGTNELRWTDDLHLRAGNLGFADGSVQSASSSRLVDVLARGPDATNRLHFPGEP